MGLRRGQRDVCGDCGADIRVNHMGQTTHRCDYKEASREAAERLAEVFVEHPDYYTLFDTTIALTVRERDSRAFYKVVMGDPRDCPGNALSVDHVVEKGKGYAITEWDPEETEPGERSAVLQFQPGHRGSAHYTTGSVGWITDVEVEVGDVAD